MQSQFVKWLFKDLYSSNLFLDKKVVKVRWMGGRGKPKKKKGPTGRGKGPARQGVKASKASCPKKRSWQSVAPVTLNCPKGERERGGKRTVPEEPFGFG